MLFPESLQDKKHSGEQIRREKQQEKKSGGRQRCE